MTVARSEALFGPTPAGARVLDVGAGDSPFADQLSGLVRMAVVLDPDYLHRPPPTGLAVVGDVTSLPFRACAFDEVHASYVLMHLPARTAIDELLRTTAPGGRVCITPVWIRRRRYFPPAVEVVPRQRRPPRRRSSAIVTRGPEPVDTKALAEACAPRTGWRILGSLAMAAVIRVRRTPQVPLARASPRRYAGEPPR